MTYKYDISILMPAIRTPRWKKMYESILQSCTEFSFELILVSPFDLPDDLKQYDNILLIKDYGCPTRAAQIGAIHCRGKLLYHCVDDAIFLPKSIDNSIYFYNKVCQEKDVVNMRYSDGVDYKGHSYPISHWNVCSHEELYTVPGIRKDWKWSMHFLISLEYFRYLGGWDCQFEYLNHALHDLIYRLQANGGTVYNSLVDVTTCDWMPGKSGDHAAIHNAQITHDAPIFNELYSKEDTAFSRITIDPDNWKNCEAIWSRRFANGLPKNYSQLLLENNTL